MNFSEILPYVGIGIASTLGILVLVWLLIAGSVLLVTRGLPQALNKFFAAIVTTTWMPPMPRPPRLPEAHQQKAVHQIR